MGIMQQQSTEVNAEAREEIGKALGRLASGVYVVTIQTETGAHGMLASWITQTAFEPPMVAVSINAERPMLQDIQGKVISINVLGTKNMDIFKAFARPAAKLVHDDRFAALETIENPGGGAAFKDAVAVLNCRVEHLVPTGDHMLAVCEVMSARMIEGTDPMVHLRKNGFQY